MRRFTLIPVLALSLLGWGGIAWGQAPLEGEADLPEAQAAGEEPTEPALKPFANAAPMPPTQAAPEPPVESQPLDAAPKFEDPFERLRQQMRADIGRALYLRPEIATNDGMSIAAWSLFGLGSGLDIPAVVLGYGGESLVGPGILNLSSVAFHLLSGALLGASASSARSLCATLDMPVDSALMPALGWSLWASSLGLRAGAAAAVFFEAEGGIAIDGGRRDVGETHMFVVGIVTGMAAMAIFEFDRRTHLARVRSVAEDPFYDAIKREMEADEGPITLIVPTGSLLPEGGFTLGVVGLL